MNTKFRGLVVRTFCIVVCLLFIDYFILPVPFTFGGNLPTGIQDQIGSSTITVQGGVMTHTTGDEKYWGDADSFNIGANKTLNSIGPNSNAVMLYNVTGDAGSTIAGIWNSNCNQFLLNPNGILFTETARLNMGSLVASTLTMSKEDFLSGNYVLSGADLVTLGNNIINKGAITTTGPGGVTFAGGAIKNAGTINAHLGTVNLVAGKEVTLNIAGDGSIQAAVTKKLLDNVYDAEGRRVAIGVDNVGEITADGGEIRMEVGAVQDVFDTLINQEGVVRAGSMVERNGKIVLISDDEGIIQNTGTMTASAIEDGANGGTVEMRGSKVGQFGEVRADGKGSGNGGTITLYANDTVALSSGSITTANAEVDGSGGDITVYSPDTALFWSGARIEAKGGSNSGDGGFVEISGEKSIVLRGSVDLNASNGKLGTLFLDPATLVITDAADGGGDIDDQLTPGSDYQILAADSDGDTSPAPLNSVSRGQLETFADTANIILEATGQITINDMAGNLINLAATTGSIRITSTTSGGITFIDTADEIRTAGGDITLQAQGTGSLSTIGKLTSNGGAITVAGAAGVDLDGAISTSGGSFTSTGTTFDNTGGTITTAGGAVDLTGHTGAVTVGAAIDTSGAAGGTIDITGSSLSLAVANALTTNAADINLHSTPATLSTGTTLSTGAGTGNISTGAITGSTSEDLTLNAGAGNIYVGLIGSGSKINTVDLRGSEVHLYGNVTTDSAAGDTVTITGDVVLEGDVTIDTSANNGAISITGKVDGVASAVDTFVLNSGTGNVTLGDSVGSTTPLEDLTITSTGVTTLNNSITTNGADAGEDIDLSGATNVVLDSNVSLHSTNQDVILNVINGAFDLTVYAGTDITAGAAIGATNALHDISMTAGADISVNAAITGTGGVNLTSGGSAGEDITLAANVIGTSVILNAGASGINNITATQDNTSGATTYDGAVTINGDITLTSNSNMTFNGNVTVTQIAAGGITSTNGSLDFNGTINGAQAINLNAANGDIALQAVGNSTSPTSLDLDSLTAGLAGNINVDGAVDLSGVGLTTLAAATVDIDTVGGTTVNLGALTGANNLTISAGTIVTLSDADIASLVIDDATTVTFNGDFVTSGALTVGGADSDIDGNITVANSGSIQAGGAITLDTKTGAGGVSVVINGNVSTTGSNTITITSDDDVNIAQTAAASISAVNGEIDITNDDVILLGDAGNTHAGQIVTTGTGLIDINTTTAFTMNANAGTKVNSGGAIDIDPDTVTIAGGGLEAVGNITVNATDTITVNGVVNSTSGSTALTVTNANANTGTINVAANVIGDDVAITASDTAEIPVINVTSAITNNRGGITFEPNTGTLNIDSNITAQDFIALNGGAAIQLAANLTATDNNITVNNALTLDGGTPTITATSGNVTFSSTINGAYAATVSAPSGTVTFTGVVGGTTPLSSLIVSANTASVGGNISTDNDGNVDFTGTDTVTLTANTVIDTELNGDATAGDILFKTTGIINGDFDLDLVATGNADGAVQIATVDTNSLDINTTGTTTLYNNITADDDVSLDGATDVNLAGDIIILGDGSTNVLLNGGNVAGDYDLAIDSGAGTVTLDAIDANKLTVTAAGITTIGDNIITDEGMDFGNASDVDIAGGVTLANTDSGTVDLSGGDVDVSGALTVNASATNVKLGVIDLTGALDVNSTGVTTIVGNVTTTNSNIGLDGATNVVLGANVQLSSGAGAGDIDLSNSAANSLSGAYTLTLIAGTGTVQLDNIADLTGLTVFSSATTQFVGSTNMAGAISVDATTLIDVDGTTVTTGAVTLDSGTNVDIDGAITASGNVDIDADNDVTVDANITADGNYIITITADSGTADNAGDLNIAQAAAATITSNSGAITLEGENILLGSGSGAGKVRSTGNGDIKITANKAATVGSAGNFTIAGIGSEVNSGGSIDVDDPYDVTIGGAGMTAEDDIFIVAYNDVDIDAPVNSTMAGDISITANTGNITLADEVRTTTTGDISMTATAGYIDDADAATEDEYIAGDVVTLTASGGIGATTSDIDTRANSLDASSITAGNIVIDEYDSIILTDVDTANGSITVSADGQITATDVQASGDSRDVTLTTTTGGMILTLVTSDNDITATANAGDITIGQVGDSGTEDIFITATTGSIDEIAPGDGGVDIVGDAVTLTAEDGIGGSLGLETTITSLDASVTSVGDIDISDTDTDGITLTDVDTVNGDITVSAGGLITATDVDAGGNDGDVSLTTSVGAIVMTLVLANDDITAVSAAGITIDVVGDTVTDDVTLTAQSGSILGIDVDNAAEITADAVVLTATGAIGGASGGATEIETEVTTFSADSTSAGDIIFEELDADGDGINLLSVDANDGNVTAVTNGGTAEAGTETTLTYVISDSGVIGIHDISITATTGDITLSGNTSDVKNVQSDDDITLIATAGSITEDSTFAVQGDSYVDIVGDKLTITAQDEIGSSTGEYDIETTIANLDASSTSQGDIIITETDAVGLDDVDTANGAITIVAGGQITATNVASLTDADSNDISLTSTGSGIEAQLINAGTTAGDVTLDAQGGAITQDGDVAADVIADVLTATAAGGIDLDTTVNSVSGTASSAGTITLDETDAVTLTSLSTTDGFITVTSNGAMTVTDITAGGDTGSNDDVTLTTTSGDIIMSGDITALNDEVTLTSAANITDTTDGTTDISAANLTITASSGTVGASGTNNELDTDVDTLTLAVQGDSYILEENAITLTSVVTTNGLIDIEAAGNITTTTVTAGGSNGVTLYATTGNIADTGGAALLTAGAISYLKADNGIIGTIANHYNVDINGDLWVKAGAETDEVSAIMDGTVKSTFATERVEILQPAPPGLVILNNRLMGGSNYGSGSSGGSILSRGYGFAIIEKADMFNFFYGRALSKWGYKITAPWALSEANFLDDSFLNGPPIIMDGSAIGVNVLPGELLIAPVIFQPKNYYIIRQIKK